MMELLQVRNLTKSYRSFTLQDISFDLPAGYIMGYIGQNGAGKTTTLKAMTHLIRPGGGETLINGIRFEDDPITYRDMIGYVGDTSYFPIDMTQMDVRAILKDFYPSFDGQKYDSYVQRWKLPPKEKIKTYSRGMMVKLMFAAVLSRQTKLMILDEATNGLDPMMRREILALLQDYIADGEHSVLFSTHIMEDLQDIADYIFFIDDGKKVLCEMKDDLLENYLLVHGGNDQLTDDLKRRLIGIEKNAFGFTALAETDGDVPLSDSLQYEKPTIDQIVVHMLMQKNGRTLQ